MTVGEKLRYLLDMKMSAKTNVMDKDIEVGGTVKVTMTWHTRKVGQNGKAKKAAEIAEELAEEVASG